MNRILVSMLVAVSGLAFAAKAAPYTNAAVPRVLEQDDQNYVILHGSNVNVHGSSVRYEPQTNKLTIGYWTKVDDWVHWDFVIKRPCTLAVEILQGCGKGSGGSNVDFIFKPEGGTEKDEQKLPHLVRDTGHFQKFVPFDLGNVKFEKAGRYVLEVRPRSKPGVAVMDLRLVILKPVPPAEPTEEAK